MDVFKSVECNCTDWPYIPIGICEFRYVNWMWLLSQLLAMCSLINFSVDYCNYIFITLNFFFENIFFFVYSRSDSGRLLCIVYVFTVTYFKYTHISLKLKKKKPRNCLTHKCIIYALHEKKNKKFNYHFKLVLCELHRSFYEHTQPHSKQHNNTNTHAKMLQKKWTKAVCVCTVQSTPKPNI